MPDVFLSRHPLFLEHDTGPGHPECADRLRAIDAGLRERGLLDELEDRRPPQAMKADLLRVHDADYIDSVLAWRNRSGALDADTVVSPASVEASLHAAGALIDGIDAVLDNPRRTGFCLVRPPGHHAERDRAMGFCLFNNVAVGAAHAVAKHGLRRVLIFDPDVHHGNGTQNAFYRRGDVFYVSIHQSPLFPGTGRLDETGAGEGAGRNANVPLPAGLGDPEYLHITENLLLPLIAEYRPELVLFSAGFDAHLRDPLAQMEVTDDGFLRMYGMIVSTLSARGIPFLCTLEGGYSLDVIRETVPALIESVFRERFPEPGRLEPAHESARAAVTFLSGRTGNRER